MANAKPNVTLLCPPFALHKQFIDYPYFANLGMLHNAAACRAAGFRVRVIDALSEPFNHLHPIGPDHFWMGCRAERVLELLNRSQPETLVICGHPFLNIHFRTAWLSGLIDNILGAHPDCTLIYSDSLIGGMHFADTPAAVIRKNYPQFNFVVKYHSETALPALLLQLARRESPESPDINLVPVDLALDDLPFPAWDLVDIGVFHNNLATFFTKLRRPGVFRIERNTLPAVLSRGCAFRCSFCTANTGLEDIGYKRLSTQRIEQLVAEYRDRYKCRRVAFLDGLPNPSLKILDTLIEIMDAAGLNYDFLNGIRADRVTRRQLERMKKRITMLSISAESGDPETITNCVGKNQSPESAEQVAAWCRELEIPLIIHYIIGFPDENTAAVQKTLSHALRMHRDYSAQPTIQFATPFPGTALYRESGRRGLLTSQTITDYAPWFSTGGLIEPPHIPLKDLQAAHRNWQTRLHASDVRKVIINLTYACNNNCVFCATGDRSKKHSDLNDVLQAIYKYRKRGADLLDFDGGEPTLYSHLFQAIAASCSAGYSRISLTTNGRRLAKAGFAKKLLGSGLSDLLISLYGASAVVHESITRTPGSFDETVQGIRNASDMLAHGQKIAINTTLCVANLSGLSDLAAFIIELGIPALNIQMLTPFGSARSEHTVDPAEAADCIARTIDTFSKRIDIQVINAPPCLLPDHAEHIAPDVEKHVRDMVFIGCEGTNLSAYLASRRGKAPHCASCIHNLVCDGIFDFKQAGS